MSIKPRAFLKLARELSGRTGEAALRSSVSRGYYALFDVMAAFVSTYIERLSSTASDHELIYRYFHNCGDQSLRDVASSLNDLREERNDSDYDLANDKFANQWTVQLLFKKAELAFDSFEQSVNSRNKRGQVVKGIKTYQDRVRS